MPKKNSEEIIETPVPEEDEPVLERVNWYMQFEFFCRCKERLDEITNYMNELRDEIYHMKERQKSGKSNIFTPLLDKKSSTAGETTIKQLGNQEIDSDEMKERRRKAKKQLIEEIIENEKKIEQLVIESNGVNVVKKSTKISNDNGRHTCTQPYNVTLESKKDQNKNGKQLYFLQFVSPVNTTLQGARNYNMSIQGVNNGSRIKKAGNKKSK